MYEKTIQFKKNIYTYIVNGILISSANRQIEYLDRDTKIEIIAKNFNLLLQKNANNSSISIT